MALILRHHVVMPLCSMHGRSSIASKLIHGGEVDTSGNLYQSVNACGTVPCSVQQLLRRIEPRKELPYEHL